MGAKITHRRLKPKKESTFGMAKKPFKGKGKNRKGSKKESVGLGGAVFEHKRIKPVYDGSNDNSASEEDQAYLTYLKTLDVVCFCCGEQNGIEWHHVKLYSSDKKDHKRLIPLCGKKCHILGQELSAHGTPKKWRDTYSMDEQNAYADKFYKKYLKEML